MKSTQVTTWRRYTTAEKKTYQDRVRRRRETVVLRFAESLGPIEPWQRRLILIVGAS